MNVTEKKLISQTLKKSEEMFRIVAETASDGILTMDRSCKIHFVNNAAASIFGYRREEMIGMDCSELFDRVFSELLIQGLDQYIKDGIRPDYWSGKEFTGYRQDKSSVELEVSLGAAADSDYPNITAIVRDIGFRKQAAAKIKTSEAMLARAQRIAHVGSWDWDLRKDQITWSDEHFRIFGSDVRDGPVSYEFFEQSIHPAYKQTVKEAVENSLKTGEPFNVVFHIIRNDNGEQRIVHSLGETKLDEEGKPIFASGTIQDITEFREIEAKLMESENRYRLLAESMPQQVWTALPDGTMDYANSRWVESYGDFQTAASSGYENVVHPGDIDEYLKSYQKAIENGIPFENESRLGKKNSEYRWHLIRCFPMRDSDGNIVKWLGTNTDIHDLKTAQVELKKTQDQLRQSQKLESIGRLAGGIAHDFNNMLTAINGYSSLILKHIDSDNPIEWQVAEIKRAGERSAKLTHQLLAFSRQQVLKPEILDINKIIDETSQMLRRLVSENIDLQIKTARETGMVQVDPGQLTQVIVNLAINACDAMPNGGKLVIETANAELDDHYPEKHFLAKREGYVMIAVHDTGIGMDNETMDHIFEPFFTTKEVGRGTGLGLATVHGIVSQSGGVIRVYSELNKGTTFKLFFPRTNDKVLAANQHWHGKRNHGHETILLVEDEEMVRNLARHILEMSGYTVIEARNGIEALKLFRGSEENIELVITDVVMPEMDGRELSERLKEQNPNLTVLFMSGYTNEVILKQFVTDASSNFILKPFTFESFAHKVREILDS
ncbi:MAG: PAS domain S-box protein [Pyrinomonadaceae bacterium]|nr:PAS domain S-box protein [Pyrinomonadaceae bacterium]